MNNSTHFTAITDFLRQAQRDISNRKIAHFGKLNRSKLTKAKKQFCYQFKNISNNYAEIKTKRTFLILDHVLINQKMQVIDRPYNWTYNHVSRKMEPCLVILFAVLWVEGQVYPITFDFWISEIMLEDDEVYLSKNQMANQMITRLVEHGCPIDTVLFDAAFCSPDLLNSLLAKGLNFICRFPKSRKLSFMDGKWKAQELFANDYNGSFYYDDKFGFMKSSIGVYANHLVQLVAIANSKEKLLKRDFYCILTNCIHDKYPQNMRHYNKRGSIEYFFKKLKSYLGLCSFNSHFEDTIKNHIDFCLSGYVLVQEYAHQKGLTFYQGLMRIQGQSREQVELELQPIWVKWSKCFVDIAVAEKVAV